MNPTIKWCVNQIQNQSQPQYTELQASQFLTNNFSFSWMLDSLSFPQRRTSCNLPAATTTEKMSDQNCKVTKEHERCWLKIKKQGWTERKSCHIFLIIITTKLLAANCWMVARCTYLLLQVSNSISPGSEVWKNSRWVFFNQTFQLFKL